MTSATAHCQRGPVKQMDMFPSMGVPKNGRFIIRENPHLQWMITRCTPMTSETPRWTRFFTANHGGNGGRTLEFRHQTFGDEPPRRPNIDQEDSSGFNLGIKTPKKTWSKSLPVGVTGSGMPQTSLNNSLLRTPLLFTVGIPRARDSGIVSRTEDEELWEKIAALCVFCFGLSWHRSKTNDWGFPARKMGVPPKAGWLVFVREYPIKKGMI